MKVLILTAALNGGNKHAAEALAEQFEKQNVGCEILDALTFFSEKDARVRIPARYAKVCRKKDRRQGRSLSELAQKGAASLQEKLLSESFGAIVSIHVFASMTVTQAKKKYSFAIPHYFVSTDYTCPPGVHEISPDGCFLAHGMLYGEFVRSAVPAEKMLASGVPLPARFYETVEKNEARRALEIPEEGTLILLNCTGVVDRGTFKRVEALSALLPSNARLTVLCGRNEALADRLSEMEGDRLTVERETQRLHLYLSAADVYLTPPVGLLVAEGMAKRVPIVLVGGALRGYERSNAAFLAQQGVAEGLNKAPSRAAKEVAELLSHPELAETRREAMDGIMPPIAADQICRYILKH